MAATALSPPATVPRWRYYYKFAQLVAHCLIGVLVALTLPLYRRHMLRITTWWYRRLLAIFNVKLEVVGEHADKPILVVANHVSWMDIAVLGSLLEPAFISKAEVGKWPVLGAIARATGTVLLPRGAFKTAEVAGLLAHRLAQGRNVVLFPEATTSAEAAPKHFHARLFAAAIEHNYPVLPTAIRYMPHIPGEPGHHSWAPWVGDGGLGTHLCRLLNLQEMTVRIQFCPLIEPENNLRGELAHKAHDAITTALGG